MDKFCHNGLYKHLWVCDWGQFLFFQLFICVFVISKIKLCADQNYWSAWTVMPHFRIPLKVVGTQDINTNVGCHTLSELRK